MLTFYGYGNCDTCRKARKWLDAQGLEHRFVDITQSPPPPAVLRRALQAGYAVRELFNTSGVQYRQMKMKDRLATLSVSEAVTLLAKEGRLCKRPVVTDGAAVTVGFRPEAFEQTWRELGG